VSGIAELLKELKLESHDTESHFQVDCPLCTDTRKRLGILKTTGQWHCFNCNSKGTSVNTLRNAVKKLKNLGRNAVVEYKDEEKVSINQKLGPALMGALSKNDEAKDYLFGRGITKECIEHFKLGARSKFKSKDGDTYSSGLHIAMPSYENDKLVNVKYRAVEPKTDKKGNLQKWKREKGGKTTLFNYNVLNNHDYNELYICESEIDCMSLWSNGFENVVGLAAGAGTFKQDWIDQLERFEKIYLVLDNDKAGQSGAKEIARRLGIGKCYNVVLPDGVKDPNEFFASNGGVYFKSIVNKSKRFDPKNITDLKTKIIEMISDVGKPNLELEGLDTGWANVNKILGKVQPGNLITFVAKPKVGKTTIVMNWLLYLAFKDYPTFNYQCEMEETDMVMKYGAMVMPMPMPDIPKIEYTEEGDPIFNDYMHQLEFEEACEDRKRWFKSLMLKLPLHNLKSYHPQTNDLLDDKDGTAIDKVCKKITEVVQRFGCKVIIFDNLHFLCRGDRAKEQIDTATRRFKLLAKDLQIVFVLVTHPRKTNHNRSLTMDDLKDSASIAQDSDAMIFLHRAFLDDSQLDSGLLDDDEKDDHTTESALDSLTEIKVLARRHAGGRTFLNFNDTRATFKSEGTGYIEQIRALHKKMKNKRK